MHKESVPLAVGWRADWRELEWRQETIWELVPVGQGNDMWHRGRGVDRRWGSSGSYIGRVGEELLMGTKEGGSGWTA